MFLGLTLYVLMFSHALCLTEALLLTLCAILHRVHEPTPTRLASILFVLMKTNIWFHILFNSFYSSQVLTITKAFLALTVSHKVLNMLKVQI